jgi:predicted tellurium resistance membrane protein TerC
MAIGSSNLLSFIYSNLKAFHRFFTVEKGVRLATPLFICLICVELSDVVFAIDSVPAVFGVTEDPFIVFTSNMLVDVNA